MLVVVRVVEGRDARLEQAMAPYWAEHAAIDVTPRARRPDKTVLRQTGPRVWEAAQKIVDPAGDELWMLDCVVDLTEAREEDSPVISLRRIGT